MKNVVFTACVILLSHLGWAAEKNNATDVSDGPSIVEYQFAIYLIPDCGKDPAATVKKQAQTLLRNFNLVASTSIPAKTPSLSIKVINNAQTEYSPPNEQSLQYFGRGVSIEDGKKLQKSNEAIILNFSYPMDYVLSGMQEALAFTRKLAQVCNGLIWDESTREIFSPDAWHKKRIASWGKDGPNIADHTVIHAYKNT
jgi:hypothetical protein